MNDYDYSLMTITSNYDGKCKKCDKEWKVGQQIYWQKEPKCICIDSQCFESQKSGASSTTNANQTNFDPNQAKVTRTTQQREADLGAFIATAANASVKLTGADIAQVWCRQ